MILAGLSLFSLTACSDSTTSEANTENTTSDVVTTEIPTEAATEELTDPELTIVTEEIISDDGKVHITNLEGKTYSEIIDAGYKYSGRMGMNDKYTILITSDTIPEGVDSYLYELADMTLSEVTDKNINVSYLKGKTSALFYFQAESFIINFELSNGFEILEQYKDNHFIDIEDITELRDKKLINPSIGSITYTLTFKEDISSLMGDDFDESMLNDYVVDEFYYTPLKAAFE